MLSGTNETSSSSQAIITANGNAACRFDVSGSLMCQSTRATNPNNWDEAAHGKAQSRVTMSTNSVPNYEIKGRNDPGGITNFDNYQTLATGSTVTYYGMTCKASSGTTMHCVGAKGGFTVSPEGMGMDP